MRTWIDADVARLALSGDFDAVEVWPVRADDDGEACEAVPGLPDGDADFFSVYLHRADVDARAALGAVVCIADAPDRATAESLAVLIAAAMKGAQ